MDDQAIGGGAGNNMGPSAAEKADNSGPLEKRIISKNWSVRAGAFEELLNLCKAEQPNSKKEFFNAHVDQWKVYLKDSNPGALEKALVCLEAFLDKIRKQVLMESQNEILTMLIEKCLGHVKPVIKQKAQECVLIMLEVSENFQDSVETLNKMATNKVPKVAASGTLCVALLIENFGIKKMKVGEYAESMLKNAQHTNPAVKNAAYEFYKAVYKWIGDAIKPQIEDKLKKAQMDDLGKLFAEVKEKGDKSKRVVRSEKAAEEEEKKNAAIDAAMEEEKKEDEAVVDALEFAPEVDILPTFTVEWQEATAGIKKWNEKKDKLEEIVAACKNKKVKPGHFDNLSNFLKKEIAATNINTSLAAIDAGTAIGEGMRQPFGPQIKILLPAVLKKFKEKRGIVQLSCNNFCDVAIKCSDLAELGPEYIPSITDVAPGVKTGTLKFIEKAAIVTFIDKLQNVAPELLPAMVKAIDDKDAGVRETALHCMGILKGRLGDGVTSKHLAGVNKQKAEKIDEASKEIKPSKFDRPENWKPPVKKAVKKKVEDDDDDAAMTFESSAPIKKKPAGIGKKPVKKAKPDAEMKDEEEKKPASSTTKRVAPTKGPTAPVIQEEDLGSGLSKEEAEEKVAEFFSADVVSKFDSAKWQDKKEGFEGLKEEIIEKQPSKVIIEAVAKFVKSKMKEFKESNINLMKGSVELWLCITQNCEEINKRTMQCAMQFFVDKIGDVKMSTAIKEMLMNAAELVTPKYISLQVIKYAATAKAPNTIKESCNIISDLIDDFGMGGFPLKEIIDYAKVAVAHATPAVRQAAIKLFAKIFQHVGEAIRNFMGDIKESTAKLIDAELKPITPYKKGEHEKKRFLKGQEDDDVSAAPGEPGKKKKKPVDDEDDFLASLPREDISKKLSGKLLENFKHKDWKIRKKAGEDTEQILKDAKMRIENNGLLGLMDALKNGMKDPNKAVVKVFIQLIGNVAEAVGPTVKQFGKKAFVPMLANLSDKQSLVRGDVVAAINKWSDQIGAEYCINHLCQLLTVENPEGRTESLKWILEHEDSIKDVNEPKEMIKPLMSCLTDKSKPIRDSTEKVIGIVMPIVGYSEFLGATKDFKTAVQQTLKPILERIKSNMKTDSSDKAPKEPDEDVIKPKKKAAPVVEEEVEPPKNSFAKKAEEKKKAAPPVSSRKKNEEDDGITIKPLNKAKRAQVDSRSKYPLNEVKGDHVEKLQNFCADAFGLKFHDLMFAKAQNFEKHIKCVKQLDACINTQQDEILEVLDLIFKWFNLRVNESSNTQLITIILDFYANLFTMFIERDYKMQEFEALVSIGTICDKSGINNKILQEKVRKLVKMCYEVYDKKATLRIIIDQGVKNKNMKSSAEGLDMVAQYIQENGPDHILKKDYNLLIQCADAKDKDVRENSLKTFGELYKLLGDSIQSFLVKDVPLKVKDLLEQRFKGIQKQQAKDGVPVGAPKNLNSSINSNRSLGNREEPQNRLAATQNPSATMKSPMNRKTMAPTSNLQSSLGGFKNKSSGGLQFNRNTSAQKGQEDIEPEVENERVRIDNLDIHEDSMPHQEEEKMQIDQQPNMQDVFQGKTNFNQQDVDMEPDLQREDNTAQQIGGNKKNNRMDDRQNNEDEIAEMLRKAEEMDLDPAVKEQQQNILKHIRRLKIGDLLERVDSLVALNEIISTTSSSNQAEQTQEQKNQLKALIYCCNQLINAFTVVMKDIFRHQVQDIPLRFTKYFITIVNKSCSSKEIMREVSEQSVHDLVEQLLTRLLIDNLDKIGQNKEGELILKNLNSSMLRMLENCNHTYVFGVLFGLLKKSKEDNSLPKLPGLIIKCLLKLSKIMDKLIEKMDMQKFLVAIHEYLVTIDHDNKTQNDDLGVRIVKTLVNEVVKLKQEKIWESYAVIENHPQPDNHIKKWVQIIIRSLPISGHNNMSQHQPQNNNNSSLGGNERMDGSIGHPQSSGGSRMMTEFEFKKIVKELREVQTYDQGIQRLDKFIKSNPQYDYKNNLRKESDTFAQKVITSLNQFQMNGYSGLSTNNSDSLGGRGQPQDGSNSKTDKLSQFKANLAKQKLNTSSSSNNMMQLGQQDLNRSQNKMSAFDQKMAKLQQSKTGAAQTGRFSTMVGQSSNGQQNLNTSISAMNQKLSQKWSNMSNNGKNKIGGLTGRPTQSTQNLSQTLNTNPMGSQNQLNSSNNKFQSKIQGSFASRVQQNKLTSSNNANAGFNQIGGNQTPGQSAVNTSQVSSQQQNQSASKIGGGISSNSFRSRLQPRMSNNPGMGAPTQGGIGAHTNMPQSTGLGGPQSAASSQDLQKRLADMKAKLQGLKKN